MGSLVAQSSLVWVLAAIAVFLLIWLSGAVRYIPNNRVGIVEKLWSRARLGDAAGFIALQRRGRLPARRAARRLAPLLPVPVPRPRRAAGHHPAGQDRLRLRARRRAAAADADAGLQRRRRRLRGRRRPSCASGGQRGPQRQILREGTYAINLAQFVVITERRRSTTCRSSRDEATDLPARWPRCIAERDGFAPVVITRRPRRHRHRPRRPVAAAGRDHRPDRRRRSGTPRALPQQLPGPGAVPRGRRPARPPAAGAGRGHLLHQPPVRDGRADPQDGRRGRPRRRGRLLHRRAGHGPLGRGLPPRRAGHDRQARRVERAAAARASTRSTPTPAR